MKVKSESEVAQSCLTLSDPMDCSLTGSSVHGTFQARVLEWGAIAFSVYVYNFIQNDSLSKFRAIMLYYHDYMLQTFLDTSLHIKSLEITGQFSEIELKF